MKLTDATANGYGPDVEIQHSRLQVTATSPPPAPLMLGAETFPVFWPGKNRRRRYDHSLLAECCLEQEVQWWQNNEIHSRSTGAPLQYGGHLGAATIISAIRLPGLLHVLVFQD